MRNNTLLKITSLVFFLSISSIGNAQIFIKKTVSGFSNGSTYCLLNNDLINIISDEQIRDTQDNMCEISSSTSLQMFSNTTFKLEKKFNTPELFEL